MKIAVDLRSLQTGVVSGVENYILNLLEHLLAIDQDNQYVFFSNSLLPESFEHLQYVNSKIVQTRIPNRVLNLSLKVFSRPHFEQLIGDFDILFLPNANRFGISSGKKLVITVHDLSPIITPQYYSMKGRLWHKFLNVKKIYERADQLIAVSEHTKHDLIKLTGIEESKISVINPGIDRSTFDSHIPADRLRDARNVYGLPGKYLLFVSTLEPRKNLIGLIKAFEATDSDAHLVIVGKLGWKYGEILEALGKSKKKRSIKYLGYVDETDKPAIMKLARAVVYPSFYEGFGFVPLEAMSLGVPVVTSQVSAIPEIVGDAALLVNPYNIDDLAFALSEVLTNESVRSQLIAKGSARAERFSWERTAEQTLAVFNSLR
ncbi:MAG: glycosyltransferase family 4 protein [Candidatus Doudnabacteria bacterium]|nr:glycosyltransferase family 4 protein [Candidatus Doudnabacteria bacterium]